MASWPWVRRRRLDAAVRLGKAVEADRDIQRRALRELESKVEPLIRRLTSWHLEDEENIGARAYDIRIIVDAPSFDAIDDDVRERLAGTLAHEIAGAIGTGVRVAGRTLELQRRGVA